MGVVSIIGLVVTVIGTIVTAIGKSRDSEVNMDRSVERYFEKRGK